MQTTSHSFSVNCSFEKSEITQLCLTEYIIDVVAQKSKVIALSQLY